MSTDTEPRAPGRASTPPIAHAPGRQRGWFRALWRWHFYASFLVAPVLLVLAVTGLVYLFRFQLEPLLNADLMRVTQPVDVDVVQPYAGQLAAVERAFPDATVVSMTEPGGPDESTRFSLTQEGAARDVFVNPWDGEVLGSLDPDRTLSGYAVRIHGELMAGRWGDLVIELAACWAIVMALTGYYLFWKGRAARRRRRQPLRSRHALVGTFVGVGLLTLVVTGLPWTGVWGTQVQRLATASGSSLWSEDHGALSDPTSSLDESLPHSHSTEVPWGMGKSPVPRSGEGLAEGRNVANLDTALLAGESRGLRSPMTVALPADEAGVFSVIGYAFDDPSDERSVHVDRFGGQVVSSYGFADYPLLAKVVSQGLGLHEGRSLGLVSFWGAALLCLAVVFMCVTGPQLWWRRRGKGSVGAPRGRLPLHPAVLVPLAVLAVVLPVFGGSLVVVLALDAVVLRRIPALGGWFDVS